jgi:Flp pilus assembly protein TadD
MAVAGGAVALVAIAGGVLVSRSLRAPEWARIPGAIAEVVARPSRASSPEAAPVPAFPHPEDRASYEQGRRLLAAGQAKRALAPLGDAARGLPQDPAVAHDYGLALVGAGEEDRGLFQLEHASRLAPGIQSYRLDLIRALLAAGRRGPAARELRELLARDPTNQSAAEMLAGLAAATGSAGVPGAAPSIMDLGGAASGSGSPRPAPVGGAFTNEDLGRRPAALPSPAPISPSPAASASPGPAA